SMRQLTDPPQREQLRAETAERTRERGDIMLSSVEGGEELEGRRLGDLAREARQADVDCLFELLARHAGRALAVYHWPDSLDGLADLSTWDNGRVSPSGIAHVIVNGEVVVHDGVPTGSLPGKIVGRT